MLEEKNVQLEHGIILLCFGHPYYGRYAFNLAVSLKAVEPEMPIACVYFGRVLCHLRKDQLEAFDYLIEGPEGHEPGFGSKLILNELSPFKHTIFLDVDTVWLPKHKPSELFEKLKDYDFTGITEGYYDIVNGTDHGSTKYYYWAKPEEIISVHKPKGNIYQWRTEFMYWEKGKVSDQLFKTARKVYEKPKLKTIKKFAHSVPDELAINVACAIHDIHPHQLKWQPTYWPIMNNNHIPDFESLYNYYLFSCGSNYASGSVKKVYDRVMKVACMRMGYQYTFNLHSKKEFSEQRAKM